MSFTKTDPSYHILQRMDRYIKCLSVIWKIEEFFNDFNSKQMNLKMRAGLLVLITYFSYAINKNQPPNFGDSNTTMDSQTD